MTEKPNSITDFLMTKLELNDLVKALETYDRVQDAAIFVKEFEGFREFCYNDIAGVSTIGYGFTDPGIIAKYKNTGMSEKIAETILVRKLSPLYQKFYQEEIPALSPHKVAIALCSFVYNLGEGTLNKSSIMDKLQDGKYQEACAEIRKYNKFRKPKSDKDEKTSSGHYIISKGLERRREAECNLIKAAFTAQ